MSMDAAIQPTLHLGNLILGNYICRLCHKSHSTQRYLHHNEHNSKISSCVKRRKTLLCRPIYDHLIYQVSITKCLGLPRMKLQTQRGQVLNPHNIFPTITYTMPVGLFSKDLFLVKFEATRCQHLSHTFICGRYWFTTKNPCNSSCYRNHIYGLPRYYIYQENYKHKFVYHGYQFVQHCTHQASNRKDS